MFVDAKRQFESDAGSTGVLDSGPETKMCVMLPSSVFWLMSGVEKVVLMETSKPQTPMTTVFNVCCLLLTERTTLLDRVSKPIQAPGSDIIICCSPRQNADN